MGAHGHMLLDFHAPTKGLFSLQVQVIDELKIDTMWKRLVGGPRFEKMRVATPNNPNSVGEKLLWK